MDIRQSPEHAKFLQSIGWKVVQLPSTLKSSTPIQGYILHFPVFPLGFAKFQRYTTTPNEKALRAILHQEKIFSFAFEPGVLSPTEAQKHTQLMRSLGGHIDRNVYIPSHTRWLDLTRSDSELQADFSENVRRLTRVKLHTHCSTRTAPVPEWANVSPRQFWDAGNRWNKHWHLTWGLFQKLLDAYQQKAHFALSQDTRTGDWLSGILLLQTNDTMNYFLAWTSPAGKQQHTHFWTVWQALLYAKKLGVPRFDFEGVEDPRFPHPSWRGFSIFKRKFGGTEVELPGCYTKMNFVSPWLW